MIAIPDVRQKAEYDCGDACIRALCRYYRRIRSKPSSAHSALAYSQAI